MVIKKKFLATYYKNIALVQFKQSMKKYKTLDISCFFTKIDLESIIYLIW